MCIEFIPELGEDLDLVMDLLDCVLFNMQRIRYINFWLNAAMNIEAVAEYLVTVDEFYPNLILVDKELNSPMSKLLRLYISLAVFLAKVSLSATSNTPGS